MIISMTGFGRGDASDNGYSATVEIKSLNSRYLDIYSRLPQQLQDKELELKEILQNRINRGKLNVSVHLTESNNGSLNLQVDTKKVEEYLQLLKQVQEITGIVEPIKLKDLFHIGDIFVTKEDDEEALNLKWGLVKTALNKAIDNLVAMRTREGGQLKADLIKRLDAIFDNLVEIETTSAGKVEETRDKLKERVSQLIEDENINPERLDSEIAIMADKMDITEEIVRMKSHIKFFKDAIEQKEAAGRRLNFLTQEMNRELNTIGSKASDASIAHHVVRSKETLEQIREQIQNVE